MIHSAPRRALFTPIGTKKFPQQEAYTGIGRALGQYGDGEAFEQVDNWLTDPRTQRPLNRKWCGIIALELATGRQEDGAYSSGCPVAEGSPPVPLLVRWVKRSPCRSFRRLTPTRTRYCDVRRRSCIICRFTSILTHTAHVAFGRSCASRRAATEQM